LKKNKCPRNGLNDAGYMQSRPKNLGDCAISTACGSRRGLATSILDPYQVMSVGHILILAMIYSFLVLRLTYQKNIMSIDEAKCQLTMTSFVN